MIQSSAIEATGLPSLGRERSISLTARCGGQIVNVIWTGREPSGFGGNAGFSGPLHDLLKTAR
jgi:hypothetical protein